MTEILSPFSNPSFDQLDFEAAQQFSREAMKWLHKQLGEHSDKIVTQDIQRETPREGLVIERLQSWGGIDEKAIKNAGPSIEVGGPSKASRYEILPDFKPIHISNIVTEAMEGGSGEAATGPVDFAADARALPFADKSVGSVKAACLPDIPATDNSAAGLREEAIHEAARVIKPGGFLIWDAGTTRDFGTIIESGFKPVSMLVISSVNQDAVSDKYYRPRIQVNGVFQKRA